MGMFSHARKVQERGAKKITKDKYGLVSEKDVARIAERENPKLFGFDASLIPDSAPDEEELFKARRRSIARQRRRSGRMSTILTGFGGQSETLG